MESSVPSASSVENAFRPAFEEIRRRGDAAAALPKEETTHFERSPNALDLPFVNPEQIWALVSLGTAVLAPRPADQSRPALRVYGAFREREEAVEHAHVVQEVDPACSLVVVKMREWILMPQTEAARDDRDEAERRLQARLQAHRVHQAEEGEAFDRMVNEHLHGETTARDREAEDQEEEFEEAEALVYARPKRLRAGAEVRGQSAVAISVIPDSVRGECLFKIMGCFETSADADNWSRNVASRHVTDDDIYVASTCDWLYPNGESRTATTHYRINELQRIMDTATQNPRKVRQYKEWKKEQDRLREERKKEEEEEARQTEEGTAVEPEEVECDPSTS
jgi:hypothetical protein